MRMIHTLLIFFLVLSLNQTVVYSQAKVTGHVFAEVVEMVGVKSHAQNHFSLTPNHKIASLSLGEYSFDGGAFTTGSILISNSNLSGNHGSEISFLATPASTSEPMQILNKNGHNTLSVAGEIDNALFRSHDKQYTGEYTIVFAYH